MDRKKLLALAALAVICMSGCSGVGNAPSGESNDDIKARMDKMSLEDHAKEIKKLSLPNDLKKKSIEDLYTKAGKTAPPEILADLGGGTNPGGAPAPGAGAGAPAPADAK